MDMNPIGPQNRYGRRGEEGIYCPGRKSNTYSSAVYPVASPMYKGF
jgi:hypothetical protein